jgi:hypothetical protein
MDRKFAGLLDSFIRQAGLPLRRVAQVAGIPHQTIHNWLKGTQPRWHPALTADLHRLGCALGLSVEEMTMLLQQAGCLSARAVPFTPKEVVMANAFTVPKGWDLIGQGRDCYDVGLDPEVRYEGRPCITVRAQPNPLEFGSLAQYFRADTYRGKRLRYSAAVRAEGVENSAGLWMRVDGPGKVLAFDNMNNRPITGTGGWNHYSIALDVADDALEIYFGILLTGPGQVWMADVRLEEVGPDVPSTTMLSEPPDQPGNLNFEE